MRRMVNPGVPPEQTAHIKEYKTQQCPGYVLESVHLLQPDKESKGKKINETRRSGLLLIARADTANTAPDAPRDPIMVLFVKNLNK